MVKREKSSDEVFKAGFDLTDISIEKWQKLLDKLKIADGVLTEERRDWTDVTSRYWLWAGNDGFVVTLCNPVTGEHLDSFALEPRLGTLSYVGIEGTKEFVDKVFDYIKKHASFYKDESYGERRFI